MMLFVVEMVDGWLCVMCVKNVWDGVVVVGWYVSVMFCMGEGDVMMLRRYCEF